MSCTLALASQASSQAGKKTDGKHEVKGTAKLTKSLLNTVKTVKTSLAFNIFPVFVQEIIK